MLCSRGRNSLLGLPDTTFLNNFAGFWQKRLLRDDPTAGKNHFPHGADNLFPGKNDLRPGMNDFSLGTDELFPGKNDLRLLRDDPTAGENHFSHGTNDLFPGINGMRLLRDNSTAGKDYLSNGAAYLCQRCLVMFHPLQLLFLSASFMQANSYILFFLQLICRMRK